jgi:uncharacterized protein (TIGR00159 family)
MIDFFSKIPLKDIIDFLLVALFLYQTYRLVQKTGTRAIFMGVLAFIAIWILVSQVFRLRITGAILDRFISGGFILLMIVFQKEIREFLQELGSNKGIRWIAQLLDTKKKRTEDEQKTVTTLVTAATEMAKHKTGALIVIEQSETLETYAVTGEFLNADLSVRLVESVFFKNNPLHDGAMIIAGKRIRAAACILPIAQDRTIPKRLGLRHRAALGLSQETDARIITVSEETGQIAVAHRGKLQLNLSAEKLKQFLVAND